MLLNKEFERYEKIFVLSNNTFIRQIEKICPCLWKCLCSIREELISSMVEFIEAPNLKAFVSVYVNIT